MSPCFFGENRRPSLTLRQPASSPARALGLLACLGSLWACSAEDSSDRQEQSSALQDPMSQPVAPGAAGSTAGAGVASNPPARAAQPSQLALEVLQGTASADPLRGGRLYDRFYRESRDVDFAPADPDAPGEGRGGPDGDGSLRDGWGARIDNALGHDYRLKNFYGWDLRGIQGVYGPQYQDQSYVAPYNLLSPGLSRQDVAMLIVDGSDGVPAYGQVMPRRDLQDLLAFVLAVREHDLPQPSDIWQLEPSAPKGYVLASGGDAAAGRAVIEGSCANCHGSNGTSIMFDDGEHSLGTLSRTSAYEVWFKIVAGNPGSPMGSQVPVDEPGPVQAQVVLDVLAALCDGTAFPSGGATEEDAAPGDPRCGEYLR